MSDIKLIEGDCLDVMKTMADKSVDLIVTDPPYGIGEAAGKNKSRGNWAPPTDYGHKVWDNKRIEEIFFKEMFRVSKNQIIFGGNYYIDYLYPSPCWIVWHKDNGNNDFADCELAWSSFKSAVRYKKFRWAGMLQEYMGKNKETRVHPTQKPVKLIEWIVEKYSNEGDLICDPFMGSGTTGVACHNFNRNFIGIELDPDYFQAAKKRIDNAQKQQRLFAPRAKETIQSMQLRIPLCPSEPVR